MPSNLPQLQGRTFLSEAGFETDLIFNHGYELPHFAIFPLLEDELSRTLMTDYFQSVIDLARRENTGVVLETGTWRANQEWGEILGYSAEQLEAANHDSVLFMEDLRAANPDVPLVISGNLGPRGDGYVVGTAMTAGEADNYHRPQITALAAAGADLVSGFTITYAAEAIGIVKAANRANIPTVISFTVETDGRLPSGQQLAAAINEVDQATGHSAAYFMINCAHPTHILPILDQPGPWGRLRGIRANASKMSHEELDNCTELDRGNEQEFAAGYAEIAAILPTLAVIGGCCGTDLAHLDLISAALSSSKQNER